jgi:ABC-type sugar transport system ATPase subunit
VPHSLPKPHDRYLPEGAVRLGIRPEDIVLAPDDPAALSLTADMVQYLPNERSSFVYTNIGINPITARIKGDSAIKAGERLPVHFVFEHASYFDARTGERVA